MREICDRMPGITVLYPEPERKKSWVNKTAIFWYEIAPLSRAATFSVVAVKDKICISSLIRYVADLQSFDVVAL